ncbi:protein FAM126B isoform X2 [Lingula anatina]|nr:protein FAM126B isoform X2 [Lingula anatina]|eukprot:XP_013412516.1 protein FAM126B isoform X2 [Lingula anatina]
MDLVPTLIWSYLAAISRNQKKAIGGIEACLLGIYNLEIVTPNGKPKVETFSFPTLCKASIYHEPFGLAALTLTEAALQSEHGEPMVVTSSAMPQVEHINSQNRHSVLTYVLSCYSNVICALSPRSHMTACYLATRACRTGFGDLDRVPSSHSTGPGHSDHILADPRIKVTPGFLVELLNIVYYVMFTTQPQLGAAALDAIHNRAAYELFSDVMMVSNAIKNSLLVNPSGKPMDGPMGISVAVSPATSTLSFTKPAITNASFRTKKLPDDITVDDADAATSPTISVSISEDYPENPEKTKSGSKTGFKPPKSPHRKAEKSSKPHKKDSAKDTDGASPKPGRSSLGTMATSRQDSTDSNTNSTTGKMTVSVVKGQSKSTVDSLEMMPMIKSVDKKKYGHNDDSVGKVHAERNSGHFSQVEPPGVNNQESGVCTAIDT